MFKDYYLILEIPFGASNVQIRSAYKQQALRWHPDRNPNIETKGEMQDINEAYLILKDPEAKLHYDEEYRRYQTYQNSRINPQASSKDVKPEKQSYEYYVQDDILRKWMTNAKEQASKLAYQTLEEIKIGANAAGKEMVKQLIAFSIIGVMFSIIFRSCG